jgi:hypothetical protein
MAGGGNGIPLDYDELERWARIGYERGMRSRKGEAVTEVRRGACSAGSAAPKDSRQARGVELRHDAAPADAVATQDGPSEHFVDQVHIKLSR